MKRIISGAILLAMLISLCACGQVENEMAPTDASQTTVPSETTEMGFDGINELEPVAGTYKIHSIVGLENMAKHPDGDFELLCDIDLHGAQWVPLGSESKPFTGYFDGMSHTISNFTVAENATGGAMGFFGGNAGTVLDLCLADVTLITNRETCAAGALAGVNSGILRRCNAAGVMTISESAQDASCGSAVGVNTGTLESGITEVEIVCTATTVANLGATVGSNIGGKLQYNASNGNFTVTGGEKMNIGLLAGYAKDVTVQENAYGGKEAKVDGVYFTGHIGKSENVESASFSYREQPKEPLCDAAMALRQKACDRMIAMASVEWTVSRDLFFEVQCTCCSNKTYSPGRLYKGLPYGHYSTGLARFEDCLDENGVIKDWLYDLDTPDGADIYLCADCSTATMEAWAYAISDCEMIRSNYQYPELGYGTIPVGDWEWDTGSTSVARSQIYIDATGEQRMYEAYAQLRAGDGIGHTTAEGGHTRMVTGDAVVFRRLDGTVDGGRSFVYCTEMGGAGTTTDEYTSAMSINVMYGFTTLLSSCYVPYTWPALMTGETESDLYVTLEGCAEGRSGLYTGTVVSNGYIDSVLMEVTDAQGNTVFTHRMFTGVGKRSDSGSTDREAKLLHKEFDMAKFAYALKGVDWNAEGGYHCVVTAYMKMEQRALRVTEFDFD